MKSCQLFVSVMIALGLVACQGNESPAPASQTSSSEPAMTTTAPANDVRDVKKADTSPVAAMEKSMDQGVQDNTIKQVIDEVQKSEPAATAKASTETAVKTATETAKSVAAEPAPKPVAVTPTPAPAPVVAKAATTTAPAAPAPAVPAFNTGKCKACHAISQDKLGPAWATVVKDYGSADALAAVFKSGFAVGDRKVITNDSKWKGKAGIMTSQFNSAIKGHEDAVAKALFDAVASGSM